MKAFIQWLVSLFQTNKETAPEIKAPKIEATPTANPFFMLNPGCHGIDISHHNEKVNFDQLDQDFIYMKATEGKSFVSPVYGDRMKIAKEKGIPCGAYHYYKPNIGPIAQAEHFYNTLVKFGMGDLPPVLDIEEMGGRDRATLVQDLKLFLDLIEKFTGRVPVIYTGYYFVKDQLRLPENFARYPLWLAWYTTADKVKTPAPWKNWTLWQYSETAQVKGVGKCDVNFYSGKF